MASAFAGFQPELFVFLEQLKRNNSRPWFQKNKVRYESDVLQPALDFVESFKPRLKKISPFFMAVPKKVGGSVMRVYRDTRFAKDKTPYKTNVGIHFRHEMCKDVHSPGFYVHLEPNACFLGAGLWHPEASALKQIRSSIDHDPQKWKRARDAKKFREQFDLSGESLQSAPRGFAKDHPLLDDLKRKDFVCDKNIRNNEVLGKKFIDDVADAFAATKPFMRFLCESVGVPF